MPLKNKSEKEEITHSMDIAVIKECPICSSWITFCVSEPKKDSDIAISETWFKNKQEYWEKNKNHLMKHGYSFNSSIAKALDYVECEKVNELDGCLLIIRVGSENCPAPPSEIELTYKMMERALVGVKGIRVVITDHKFTVEKISLPQLRRLQSSVLSSMEVDDSENSVIRDLEV